MTQPISHAEALITARKYAGQHVDYGDLAAAYLDLRRLARVALDRVDEHHCIDNGIALDMQDALDNLDRAALGPEGETP